MKLAILAVVFTVLMVAQGEEQKTCKTQDDCDESECCIDWFFFKGICKPLGQEGDKCNDDFQLWGKYVQSCPCASGYDCEAVDKKDLGFATLKYNQKCVAAGSTVAPPEPTGTVPE